MDRTREGRPKMPQTCTICCHRDRQALDAALRQGTPLRTIADQHGVSKTALLRHRRHEVLRESTKHGTSAPGNGHQAPRADWAQLAVDAARLHEQAMQASTPVQWVLVLRGVCVVLVQLTSAGRCESPQSGAEHQGE